MFIIAVIAICVSCILFSDVAHNPFPSVKSSEKKVFVHRNDKSKNIIEREYYSGAIGSDFYDTIYVYWIADWIRYTKPFKTYRFDSTKWQKVDEEPTRKFIK